MAAHPRCVGVAIRALIDPSHFARGVENYGPCAPLVPASQIEYAVRWRAHALPDHVEVRAGNPALVVLARELLLCC